MRQEKNQKKEKKRETRQRRKMKNRGGHRKKKRKKKREKENKIKVKKTLSSQLWLSPCLMILRWEELELLTLITLKLRLNKKKPYLLHLKATKHEELLDQNVFLHLYLLVM